MVIVVFDSCLLNETNGCVAHPYAKDWGLPIQVCDGSGM